ncbi:hypothetical protein ACH4E8_17140 [Streptomyces sp. NPDC017979]|uniref:hypothetical protein n=1 Tax=Streptomyces sp. NPDC017979 TaxID=3365024 RepID=UPI00378BBB4D
MSNTSARRAAVAASAVSLSLLLAACGSDSDSGEDAKKDAKSSPSAAVSAAPAAPVSKTLTQADLEKLLLTKADLKDHHFKTPTPDELPEPGSTVTDNPNCQALAMALTEGAPSVASAVATRGVAPIPHASSAPSPLKGGTGR